MYTDEDLDLAVTKGIFTEESVTNFRTQIDLSNNTSSADEENFRLVSGFNDIFVVIACGLLMFSSVYVFSLFILPVLAWVLAEFFVRKRRMALPAIVLLLSFVGGVFVLILSLFETKSTNAFLTASLLSAFAAYLHYLRFQTPITIAAGMAALSGVVITLIIAAVPDSKDWTSAIIFICGVITFSVAMYWDSSDVKRKTRRSDVAFWLHLLSAPLIVHPVFTFLGIFDGNENVASMAIIILLYFLMSSISIIVDRRAFMVSSLIYVLYAISNILEAYGVVGYSFAVTGVCIGAALLLLSAFWHPVRSKLVSYLPTVIQNHVPRTN